MSFFNFGPLVGDSDPFKKNRVKKLRDISRKAHEEMLNKISPTAGKVLEKIHNVEDSVENVNNAVNPLNRLFDSLNSYNIEEALEKLTKGDHIYVNRSVYSHHGIYDGTGGVFEYQNGTVTHNDLESFSQGSGILVKDEVAFYSPDEIISRALSRFGEAEYNLFNNNCENFATWCRCGIRRE